MRSTVVGLLFVGLVGCSKSNPSATPPAPSAPPRSPATTPNAPAAAAPTRDAELLEIAATYTRYGVIAEVPQWAPTLCAAPPSRPNPEAPRLSGAAGSAAHGEKLFFLYARDKDAYVRTGKTGAPVAVGQAIVKEAFAPAVLAPNAPPTKAALHRGDKAYVPGAKLGLFIMTKVASGTPDTDDGWIYATTDAEGKHVTASGNLPTCAGCHKSAPHDRLFAKDL